MKKYTADYLAKIFEKIESYDVVLVGIEAGIFASAETLKNRWPIIKNMIELGLWIRFFFSIVFSISQLIKIQIFFLKM